MLLSIIENFLESDIGRVVSIIGIFASIIGFLLALSLVRRRKFVYKSKSISLVTETLSNIPGVNVEFDNKPVRSLTLTRVSVWNNGGKVIRKESIAKNDPIVICSENPVTILSCKIHYCNNGVNDFDVEINNEGSIIINFEFIEKNDGCIINIYHDGDDSTEFLVKGTIIDACKIKQYSEDGTLADWIILIEKQIEKRLGSFFLFLVTIIFLPILLAILFIDAPFAFFRKISVRKVFLQK